MSIFLKTWSWEKVVIYGYLPVSFYYIGQLYVLRIIEPWVLNHPLYPDGRNMYFKFTPLLILNISMVVSSIFRLIIRPKLKINLLVVIVLLGIYFRSLSVTLANITPWWIQTSNYINELAVIVWYWWSLDYVQSLKMKQKTIDYWRYYQSLFKTIMVIAVLLVFVQGLKGSAIGLVVEQSNVLPYSFSGSDAGGWLSRPISLWEHANMAAYAIFGYLLTWLLLKIKIERDKFEILKHEWWLALVLVALVWLQSRSVYMALLIMSLWIYIFFSQKIIAKLKMIRISKIYHFPIIFIIFMIVLVVFGRFWNAISNFGIYSGWEIRGGLIDLSFEMFKKHMWLGVGPGNFLSVAAKEDISGIIKIFPEVVHNGWILVLVEQGIIGLSIWICYLILLLTNWLRVYKGAYGWFLVFGLISQGLVMCFQPFSLNLSVSLVFSMLILGYEKD